MEPGYLFIGIFPLVIVIALLFRFAAGSLDHERIREYIEQRGGKIIEITWAPFGPGWFGGGKDRCYQVCYRDHAGSIHQAYIRTSMWTGVYFTDDYIRHPGHSAIVDREVESLEDENARLRAELDRLKRKERDRNSDAIEE